MEKLPSGFPQGPKPLDRLTRSARERDDRQANRLIWRANVDSFLMEREFNHNLSQQPAD